MDNLIIVYKPTGKCRAPQKDEWYWSIKLNIPIQASDDLPDMFKARILERLELTSEEVKEYERNGYVLNQHKLGTKLP